MQRIMICFSPPQTVLITVVSIGDSWVDTACTRGFTKMFFQTKEREKEEKEEKLEVGGGTSTSGMATHRKRKKRVTHMKPPFHPLVHISY